MLTSGVSLFQIFIIDELVYSFNSHELQLSLLASMGLQTRFVVPVLAVGIWTPYLQS